MKEIYQDPKDGAFKWREKQPVKKEFPFGGLVFLSVFLIIIIAVMFCGGCTVTRYEAPSGERFTRTSFGTKLSASAITVNINTNGARSMSIAGYSNDQVEGMKATAEGATTAMLKFFAK